MLFNLNQQLQKLMPIMTPLGVIIGVLFADSLQPLVFIVPWLFGLMTFAGSLGADFTDLMKTVTRPGQITVTLVILHVVMPMIAFGIGLLFFRDDSYLMTGLLLGVVIPSGITSMIWVSVYSGSISLSLSVLLIDTLLSPYIVPQSLSILVGAKVNIDAWTMSKGLFWMIVVPSLLGMLLNQLSKGKVNESLAPKLAPFTKLGLVFVVAVNSSVVAPYLKTVNWRLVAIAVIVLLLASMGYLIGGLSARFFRWNREVLVSLVFNCGMRNISAGAVIAMTFFPPAVSIPVILSMLFQQLLASLFGALLPKFAVRPS